MDPGMGYGYKHPEKRILISTLTLIINYGIEKLSLLYKKPVYVVWRSAEKYCPFSGMLLPVDLSTTISMIVRFCVDYTTTLLVFKNNVRTVCEQMARFAILLNLDHTLCILVLKRKKSNFFPQKGKNRRKLCS
jgi:hypothetical protein